MGRTHGELLSQISSSELTEWMAYFQVEPWGEGQEWIRTGQISALLANAFFRGTHHPEAFTVEGFIPQSYRVPKEEESLEVLKLKARMWATSGVGKFTEVKH